MQRPGLGVSFVLMAKTVLKFGYFPNTDNSIISVENRKNATIGKPNNDSFSLVR